MTAPTRLLPKMALVGLALTQPQPVKSQASRSVTSSIEPLPQFCEELHTTTTNSNTTTIVQHCILQGGNSTHPVDPDIALLSCPLRVTAQLATQIANNRTHHNSMGSTGLDDRIRYSDWENAISNDINIPVVNDAIRRLIEFLDANPDQFGELFLTNERATHAASCGVIHSKRNILNVYRELSLNLKYKLNFFT